MIEKTREQSTARASCACRSIRRGERNPITANWAPWGDEAAGYREAVRKARVPCCSRAPTSRGLRRSTAAREANLRRSSTRTSPCTDRCNDIGSCEIERIMLGPYGRELKGIAPDYATDHSTVAKQSNRTENCRCGRKCRPLFMDSPGERWFNGAAADAAARRWARCVAPVRPPCRCRRPGSARAGAHDPARGSAMWR